MGKQVMVYLFRLFLRPVDGHKMCGKGPENLEASLGERVRARTPIIS